MNKLIKNYTTEVPVEKTIQEIQNMLAQNGARGIAIEYDESGRVKDIFFKILLQNKAYLAKTSSTYPCSELWPMRSVVRTRFPRDMDHIKSAIAIRRAFMIPMFYDFSLDDRHSTCKSCFSVISSCSDNMFHRPQFTKPRQRIPNSGVQYRLPKNQLIICLSDQESSFLSQLLLRPTLGEAAWRAASHLPLKKSNPDELGLSSSLRSLIFLQRILHLFVRDPLARFAVHSKNVSSMF